MPRATTAAARTAPPARRARPRRSRAAVRRAPTRRVSGPARGRAEPRAAQRRKPKLRGALRSALHLRPRLALLDRLLRGRAWIVLVGVLLAGIVFFNVSLLELNEGIAQTTEGAAKLKRENAALRVEVARLGSSERIQRAAARRGLILPAPSEIRYLRAQPGADAERASHRITKPGQDAAPASVPAGAGAKAPTTPQTGAAPQTGTPPQTGTAPQAGVSPQAAQPPPATGQTAQPTPTQTTPPGSAVTP